MTCRRTHTFWPRGGCVFRWPECLTGRTCWCQSSAPKRNSSRCGEAPTRLIFRASMKLITQQEMDFLWFNPTLCPQALICSCFIPIYCGLIPPSFRGVVGASGWIASHPGLASVLVLVLKIIWIAFERSCDPETSSLCNSIPVKPGNRTRCKITMRLFLLLFHKK